MFLDYLAKAQENSTDAEHVLRHSFATRSLEDGYDIPTIQKFLSTPLKAGLGHKEVRTTMIYTHVSNRGRQGVRSPLDGL